MISIKHLYSLAFLFTVFNSNNDTVDYDAKKQSDYSGVDDKSDVIIK